MSKYKAAGQSTPAVAANPEVLEFRGQLGERSELDELVREGTRRMLQAAIDAEVAEFVERPHGRRAINTAAHPGSGTGLPGVAAGIAIPNCRCHVSKSKPSARQPSIPILCR